MNHPVATNVEIFRFLVARKLGLHFDDSKYEFLKEVLSDRAESQSLSIEIYLQFLESGENKKELGTLAEMLTVTETFFFRNADHFRVLAEAVLPERMKVRFSDRQLRFLSAGCASGEEAYSIAMIIRNHFPELSTWDIHIRGVDINRAMLARAREGLYSSWALRETPAWARDRYFQSDGKMFRISGEIQSMVDLEERNLVERNADLFNSLHGYDAIFCRNMVMYFVPDAASNLISRLESVLAPNGYLFLGHAETLRGLSHDFHLCHSHSTFYYQRSRKSPQTDVPVEAPNSHPVSMARPLLLDSSTAWVDVIQRSSERIASLAERTRNADSETGTDVMTRRPGWDLGIVLDLLRRELFGDALEVLRRMPPDSAQNADVLILKAVLLMNLADLAQSENVCRHLLSLDDMNAGAHYLMALCREHSGDLEAAEEHDRIAIYLDSDFAMPKLHLGLLTKRNGRLVEARRHLQESLALLAKEDSARILLFGGGFGREALSQLCQSEIQSLGRLY